MLLPVPWNKYVCAFALVLLSCNTVLKPINAMMMIMRMMRMVMMMMTMMMMIMIMIMMMKKYFKIFAPKNRI